MAVWLVTPAMTLAQKAEAPAPAMFKFGETWQWKQIDNRTNQEVQTSTITVVNMAGQLRFFNGESDESIDGWFRDGWLSPSAKPWRAWPLLVGKKWSVDAQRVRPDGITAKVKQDAEVVAYEEITVAAGRFMAFKIVHRGSYRNSRDSGGELNDTYWYAPDAKADVRHVRQILGHLYTRELISYRRGAP
jgi:hypothetical protein